MSDYVPFGSRYESLPVARPGSSSTFAVWLLSLGALVQVGVVSATVARPDFAAVLVVAFGVLNVLAAAWDAHKVANRGYFVAVSAWWGLVPLVYLWRRCARVHDQSGAGMTPFWVHVVPLFVFVIAQVAWTLGPALYRIVVPVFAKWVTS